MKKVISIILVFIVSVFFLVLMIKGGENPFESSGSTSRYALTEAISEEATFFLNEARASFASPDVAGANGKYFSLFTPGVSFFGVPFYLLGRAVRFPQLVTYLSTLFLSLANVFLVFRLARKLGSGLYASLLAGFVFLFGTNALSYALTYTQHHASVALILLALLNAVGERTLLKNIWLGVLIGAGLLVDIPNGIMMAPIMAWAVYKHFSSTEGKFKVKISLKLSLVGLVIGLLPLLALFGWYNYQLTGSYTRVAQVIGRTRDFSDSRDTEAKTLEQSEFKLPYDTRNQLDGLYILLVSNERGLIYYSPIVLMGVVGIFLLSRSKDNKEIASVLVGVIAVNIVSYSMFGDPWGGWSFGPRYLIPTIALLSVGVGVAVQEYKKKLAFTLLFFILVFYSLGVNTLGAMTTTQVPPKVEAVNLADPIPYTYEYNWQLLQEGKNSSLVYDLVLEEKISSKDFYLACVSILGLVVVILYLL